MSQTQYNWNNPTTMNMMGNQQAQYQNYLMNQVVPNQQMQQQRPQVGILPGRITDDPSQIQAYEVPIDSPMSVFPCRNGNEIYVKYWNGEGKIVTDVYVKVDQNKSNQENAQPAITIPYEWEHMQKQLDRIEKMLKINKYKQRTNKPKNNTGGDNP